MYVTRMKITFFLVCSLHTEHKVIKGFFSVTLGLVIISLSMSDILVVLNDCVLGCQKGCDKITLT